MDERIIPPSGSTHRLNILRRKKDETGRRGMKWAKEVAGVAEGNIILMPT